MTDKNPNQLAPISSLPDKAEWGTIFEMASQLVPTGFLPESIKTPQQAAAIMLKGRELGIPPMQALGNISIIKGKPTVQAELMMAMVKRAYGRDVIWVEESTDNHAKVGYMVHGQARFYTYTIQMAAKAGLTGSNTWKAHPAAMLRARTISAVCRMEFPEVIGGMYSPGELGDSVQVNEGTGEVITIDAQPRQVDRQTGEIHQISQRPPSPLSDSKYPEDTTGASIDVPAEPAKQSPPPLASMRRMHAVLAETGLAHPHLNAYAISKGHKSSNQFTAQDLIDLENELKSTNGEKVAELKALLDKPKPQADEFDAINAEVNALIDDKVNATGGK